ncbi:MAG TPA: M28 family peptidase [Anaerolineales bacterium]|nr:M28 family peptidase [Anaerolineales bacterium]
MDLSSLTARAKTHLEKLCHQIPNRRVGSEGNRVATTYFAQTIESFGFEVQCPEFECMDWQNAGATLSVVGEIYELQPSPYSLGVQVTAPLIAACSAADLEALDISNKVLLMRGELAKEQFMPKNFPFFQVEEQQKILQLLETKKPLAIITATRHNPDMAGALYPFPVFEDGDFHIPSVYTTDEQGERLSKHEGQAVSLEIKAERIPAHACNVVARKGNNPKERVVLFAHIDAKVGTPGALDNGTGIVTLLLLAQLLQGYTGRKCIEIVALNGEDYYSNPGEQLYLLENEGKFYEIDLGINIDGLGYIKGKTAYSLYECPPDLKYAIEQAFTNDEAFLAGEPWFQGDHMLFLMNGRPALALTSEVVGELMSEFVHTEKDTPAIVDTEKVARTALRLHKLIVGL